MKLRTTKNNIRIRIRKSELAKLATDKRIEESINLGDQVVFKFALALEEHLEQMTASLRNNNLLLSIPKEVGEQWIATNQVGIEATLKVSETEILQLLVEKDFPCLDRENEDKSDTFWELAPVKPEVC